MSVESKVEWFMIFKAVEKGETDLYRDVLGVGETGRGADTLKKHWQ